VTRSKNERVSTRCKRVDLDAFTLHEMVAAIWGEYSNYRIPEILPRPDRTNLRIHADAFAEHGFAAYPNWSLMTV
jgi:hypothetical protein